MNECQEHKRKCAEANAYYEKKLLKKVFHSWSIQNKFFKCTNQQVEEKFKLKQKERCLELLQHWRTQTKLNKLELKNEQLAYTFYLKHLMTKIIKEWNGYASEKALKRYNDQLMIEDFNKTKTKLVLNNFFELWKKRTHEAMGIECKEKLAVSVYNLKICGKVVSAWRVYVNMRRRKKILNEQAEWFLEMRFKTEFYFKWKAKFEIELKNRDKNQRALLLWSINIQRTCFTAWASWIKQRKLKQNRYKQALQQRQHDILKTCSRNFIKYSMDSKLRRLNATKKLKEKHVLDTTELQFKYFEIWYNKCNFKNKFKSIIDVKPSIIKAEMTKKEPKRVFIVGTTLEKQDEQNDEYFSPIKIDSLSKIRPAPRKPKFLNDSIDMSKTISLEINVEQTKAVNEPARQLEIYSIVEEKTAPRLPKPPLLLPPTAFTLNQETASPRVEFNEEIVITTTLTPAEPAIKNLTIPENASSHTLASEQSKIRKIKASKSNELELVEFKKRIEIFSNKTEKLK